MKSSVLFILSSHYVVWIWNHLIKWRGSMGFFYHYANYISDTFINGLSMIDLSPVTVKVTTFFHLVQKIIVLDINNHPPDI